MRISFWHFVLLVLLLAAGYFAYTHWWVKQNRSAVVSAMQTRALNSQEEIDQGKTVKAPDSGGGGDGSKSTGPARDAHGWITE
jgi:hypothetical protein